MFYVRMIDRPPVDRVCRWQNFVYVFKLTCYLNDTQFAYYEYILQYLNYYKFLRLKFCQEYDADTHAF